MENLAGSFSFNAGSILPGLIFGGIGFSAFIYGKKLSEWRPMTIGIILMGFPYFIPNPALQWAVGCLLTVSLFIKF